MKDRLGKLLAAREARKAELVRLAESCQDVEELRRMNAEMDVLNGEITELRSMIEAAEPTLQPEELRTAMVTGAVPAVVVSSRRGEAGSSANNAETADIEQRKAFQLFVTRGIRMPVETRQDQNTLTTDVPAVIPTVLVGKIVEKLESTGMILPLVTRLSFGANVRIPVSAVKPTASWVGEGATTDSQKVTTTAIDFKLFKLRCEISMSQEVGAMALAIFEAKFVDMVVEAMTKAIETAILSGAGTNSPKGILTETPNTGQSIEATALDYETLVAAEAALPQAYEAGAVWCMTKKTFMAFIGMTDAQKQPIARINYGINGQPERTLLGRTVVLCGEYMDSFSATLQTGKAFAFLFRFRDYALNTVYDLGVEQKRDWDTENLLTKAVMSVDGKVFDKGSLVILKKKA